MESTAPKFFCFVLMPFASDFDDIYNYGIKESCKDAGTYSERVDEQIFQGTTLERIYNQIAKADLIIADMTGRNANVFYEVGYAHALGKPTILLTQNADDIPFDLKHYPHIIYDKKISKIREELTKRIIWFKDNKDTSSSSYKADIDIYIHNVKLFENRLHFNLDDTWILDFAIHNNSSRTYQPGEFQIGIITEYYATSKMPNVKSTRIPETDYQHMLPFFDVLFPDAYASYQFDCSYLSWYPNREELCNLIFRVYSDFGSRDYPVILGIS